MDADLKGNQAEKEEVAKALGNSKTDLAKTISEKSASFLALQKTVEERDDEINQLKKDKDALGDDQKRQATKWTKRERDLTIQNDRLRAQLAPPNVDDYNKPKARIVKLDRNGTDAWIDIGSADGVKPPLPFSIMGVGPNGRANEVRKGAVEVVRVLGPRTSQARITEVADPGRNPIMEGDQLFNPAWSPNMRMHVALAGVIDLTGDGRDDSAEFVRNLERQGTVVDAYLDLKDLTIKGNGINRQTDYLVLGEAPSFEGNQALREGDPTVERKKAVIQKTTDMQKEAVNEGIAIVPLRRFLGMIGYRLPRVSAVAPDAALPYLGPTPDTSKQEAPAKDKDAKPIPKEK
jgi:hypothetical protein